MTDGGAKCAPEHIVLIEDDDGMRVLVTRIRRESGYLVTSCRSGADMWSLLPGTPVDLVLLDVMLPGASGFDLLRALGTKGTVDVGPAPLTVAAQPSSGEYRSRLWSAGYLSIRAASSARASISTRTGSRG